MLMGRNSAVQGHLIVSLKMTCPSRQSRIEIHKRQGPVLTGPCFSSETTLENDTYHNTAGAPVLKRTCEFEAKYHSNLTPYSRTQKVRGNVR